MNKSWINRFLPCVFVLVCAGSLALVFGARDGAVDRAVKPEKRGAPLEVAWRVQMTARPNRPCAFAGGWIVSDAAGAVTALSHEGRQVWQTCFSNQAFDCSASVSGTRVVVAAQQGGVIGISLGTGEVAWSRQTEGRFQHAPLTGMCAGEPVIWMVSQTDGQLTCLRVSDGSVVWQSEATNRCDGEPIAWQGRIAYGNCDGAIYLFDAENGKLQGSVLVGADDQMAGGLLALADGRLVAGTRQGNLVVVQAATLTREALVSLSQSEAFGTPVEAFGGLIAMGTQEGEVCFWQRGEKGLKPAGRMSVVGAVSGLLFDGGCLYVLAGSGVSLFDKVGGAAVLLAIGDEVSGLVAGSGGALACVADQAVVCLRGGCR